MRLYWGIGRLIAEAPEVTVLPFYHCGLDQVYPPDLDPEKRKFYKNKAVTMLWGDPIKIKENTKFENFEQELSNIENITETLQVCY